MDPCIDPCTPVLLPLNSTDPIKYRRLIFLISVIDFLIAFLMLSVWSFRPFPVAVMDDDPIIDHFGMFGVIWFFLLYSFQLIMAMILCGGTQKVSVSRSRLKFSRWFKSSLVICIILVGNHVFLYLVQESPFTPISPYVISMSQLVFRIVALILVAVTNGRLIFGSLSQGVHERVMSRQLDPDLGDMSGHPAVRQLMFPPPPPYSDVPPTYEEATDPGKYPVKSSKPEN